MPQPLNHNNTRHSHHPRTQNHCHEQLLVGWKGVLCEWYGCGMETGRWRGRGGWGDDQHPAPPPWATAHGVVMACECVGMMGNGNRGTRDTTLCIDNDVSTPCHCCKQQTTFLMFVRGFFVYFISFKISSYSPSPCEEGGITYSEDFK